MTVEEVTQDNITMYGTNWCYDTHRARHLLENHNIPYQWIDIDKDIEGRAFVEKVNQGMKRVPTIVFPDGSILVEPTNSQLSSKLGI